MPRFARVQITRELLEQALGFNFDYYIMNAQVSHRLYAAPVLELVIQGDALPSEFEVHQAGDIIKEANIIVHVENRRCEITAVK